MLSSMKLPVLLAVCLAAACDKNTDLGPSQPPVVARPTTDTPQTDPHAGMGGAGDMGNPHAMGGMPNDDIHAGMRMPEAVEFDPKLALDGTIDAAPKLAAQVKPGDILFLFAKKIDPDTGKPFGGPVAVDRLDVTKLPVPFHLDGSNLMMQGTKFEGTVMLFARVDRDGEARTREHGDLEGTLQATIPAGGLKLILDTPVE